jgi:mRNA interferase MazF
MTTGSTPAPFRISVNFGETQGLILLDQIRTLDKQRLVKLLGRVDDSTLIATLKRLRELFEE